ncbi:STM4012 family radical SAM protein [Verrucomicrobiota bacterium sgz303538]
MTLADRMRQQPFQGYAYAYPHKMAYRHLSPAQPLDRLWAKEDRDALFLYVHIPFCEMRCGFCNLFTTTGAAQTLVHDYLDALERQMQAVSGALGSHRFARAAFGGGTPTFLSEAEIVRLFAMIQEHLGGIPSGAPVSFEMSPGTVTPEKLKLLTQLGVTRASIGVQSFVPEEVKTLGRPQQRDSVLKALEQMRAADFKILNIDLIYGALNQTAETWEYSLREALRFSPEEIYLYPLYVRRLTGLDKLGREPSDLRPELYRLGRDLLLANGFEQISMRLFRRKGVQTEGANGPIYCCQEDGMVGLGAGARSYTTAVHYSTEYAVGRSGVQEIIRDFVERPCERFSTAEYGCILSNEEQRRRYIIKSLLRRDGLDFGAYHAIFLSHPLTDFSELNEIVECDLGQVRDGTLLLNSRGLELSDTIGPWLFSAEMQSRMEEFELV